MKIADISIKRPSLVIVIFTALTVFGLISYSLLNYELLPKFTPSVISVATVYPGASPSEVENTVTKKIEEAVASMEKVKKIEFNTKQHYTLKETGLPGLLHIQSNSKNEKTWIYDYHFGWKEIDKNDLKKLMSCPKLPWQ